MRPLGEAPRMAVAGGRACTGPTRSRSPSLGLAILVVTAHGLVGFGPCPPGALPAGAPPPDGHHQFCKKPIAGPLRFVAHGPWQTWHESGEPFEIGAFVDGHRVGPWQTGTSDGTPVYRGAWHGGMRQGPWILWGDGIETGEFLADQRVGPWTRWRLPPTRRAALKPAVPPGQAPLPGYVCKAEEGAYAGDLKTGTWSTWLACGPLTGTHFCR